MNTQSHALEISGDRVLRDMLADARDNHPNRAWREPIMTAAFRVRWGMAMILAVMSAVVAVVAMIFIASPAFVEATESYARIALTGLAPMLASLAVSTIAGASSRVLNAQRGATLLGVLGAVATSVTYELWYAWRWLPKPMRDSGPRRKIRAERVLGRGTVRRAVLPVSCGAAPVRVDRGARSCDAADAGGTVVDRRRRCTARDRPDP